MWWLDDKVQSEGNAPNNALELAEQSDDKQHSAWPTVSQQRPNAKNNALSKPAIASPGSRMRVAICLQSANHQSANSANPASDALKAQHTKELAMAREAQCNAEAKLQTTERRLNANNLQLKATIKNLVQQVHERQVEHADQLAIAKRAQQQTKSQLEKVIEKHARKTSHLNAIVAKYQKASADSAAAASAVGAQVSELRHLLAEQNAKADREKQDTEANFEAAKKELAGENHRLLRMIAVLDRDKRDAVTELAETRQLLTEDLSILTATNAEQRQLGVEREADFTAQLVQAQAAQQHADSQLITASTQHGIIVAQLKETIAEYEQEATDHDRVIHDLKSELVRQQKVLVDQIAKTEEVGLSASSKLEDTKTILNANIRHLTDKIASLEEESRIHEADYVAKLSSAQSAQQHAEARLVDWIDAHESVVAKQKAIIEEHERSAVDRSSVVRDLEAKLAEQRILLSDQIALMKQSAQAAETKLAEIETRYKEENQQLIEANVALKKEIHDFEADRIARLDLAHNGQQHAETRVAEMLRQRDETVNQLTARIADHIQSESESERVVYEMNCKLRLLNELLAEQTAMADQKAIEEGAQHEEFRQRVDGECLKLKETISALTLEIQKRETESVAQIATARAAQRQSETQLLQAVNQQDEAVSQLRASIATHEQLAIDNERVISEMKSEGANFRNMLAEKTARTDEIAAVTEAKLRETEQQHYRDCQQLHEAIATLRQQAHERDSEYQVALAQTQAALQHTEYQLKQAVNQQDEAVSQLRASISAHEQLAIDNERVISELKSEGAKFQNMLAKKTARTDEIAAVAEAKLRETEQQHYRDCQQLHEAIATLRQQAHERDSEYQVAFAQTQAALQHTESQLKQAVNQHDGAVAQLKLQIVELERLAIEREHVVSEQAAKLAEQQTHQDDLIAKSNDAAKTAGAKLLEVEHRLKSQIQSLNQRLADALATESNLRSTLEKRREETEQQREQFDTAIRIHSESETHLRESHCRIEAEAEALRIEIADLGRTLADCRMQYSASLTELSQTREQLQEQVSKLQNTLQREAAGRRKVESALKLASEVAPADSVTRAVQAQIHAEQRSERLTRELESTRLTVLTMQHKAIAKIQQSQNETARLRLQLERLRPHLVKSEAA